MNRTNWGLFFCLPFLPVFEDPPFPAQCLQSGHELGVDSGALLVKSVPQALLGHRNSRSFGGGTSEDVKLLEELFL